MAIDPGELRHRVAIEGLPTEPVVSDSGQLVNDFVPIYSSVPAAIVHLQGRELMMAQQLNAEATTRISLRYLPNVSTKNRVSWYDAREDVTVRFDIVDVNDYEMRHCWLLLLCKSGVRVE